MQFFQLLLSSYRHNVARQSVHVYKDIKLTKLGTSLLCGDKRRREPAYISRFSWFSVTTLRYLNVHTEPAALGAERSTSNTRAMFDDVLDSRCVACSGLDSIGRCCLATG